MKSIKNSQKSMTSALFLMTALLTITSWGFPLITSAQSKPTKQETLSDQKVLKEKCKNLAVQRLYSLIGLVQGVELG